MKDITVWNAIVREINEIIASIPDINVPRKPVRVACKNTFANVRPKANPLNQTKGQPFYRGIVK